MSYYQINIIKYLINQTINLVIGYMLKKWKRKFKRQNITIKESPKNFRTKLKEPITFKRKINSTGIGWRRLWASIRLLVDVRNL